MAKGRTISATDLTDRDERALRLCMKVGDTLARLIQGEDRRDTFLKEYGRVHLSRDAGLGLAGAKLQRDALCTRGRTDKAPYSNRNLRWHPLIVATRTPAYAQQVEEIAIDGNSLVFLIEGERWYSRDVYKLPKVYCAPLSKWYAIKDNLAQWGDEDWTNNSCVIPATEYSTLEWSIESFAVLGIAVVSNFFQVDPKRACQAINQTFAEQGYEPTPEYPQEGDMERVVRCPLCLARLDRPPGNLKLPARREVFQPPWRRSKREEGEAESLQLFHTIPLDENQIHHTPNLVRYGHRWCNIAATDHSVRETLDFMQAVVEAHPKETGALPDNPLSDF